MLNRRLSPQAVLGRRNGRVPHGNGMIADFSFMPYFFSGKEGFCNRRFKITSGPQACRDYP